MSNIITALPSKHEQILLKAYNDLIAFGKLFLPGDFRKSKTPWFHYEIAEELLSPSNKPCAIILSRGHAKTTLIKAKILHDFCFSKKAKEWGFIKKERDFFFGWVSSNQKKSQNNVAYVKLHLAYNDKINFYFGKGPYKSLRGDTWNQEDIVTAYGDRLISSSNLTSMRGDTLATVLRGAVRYSGVFIDDAENEENTRTESSREKIVDNIMNGIYPAVEKNEPGCRLFLVETPVHYAAFAQQILDKWEQVKKEGREDEFMWRVITYAATQPNMPGGVLWKSWLPRKKLDEIAQTYADTPGKGIDGYYQEYELQVQSYENALWGRKHLKYHNGVYHYREGGNYLFIEGMFIPVNTFLGCDPATDIETKHSDFSVIMVIAVDLANNVLEYERHKAIPTLALRDAHGSIEGKRGVVDIILDLYHKYHSRSGTVEDVAMTRSVFQDLNSQKRKFNDWEVNIIPEKPAGRDKLNKIYTNLNSRFSAGGIYVRENMYELISEITKFGGRMAHDDTIETLYFACKNSYPPNLKLTEFGSNEIYEKKRRVAKPWIVA